MKQDVDFSSLSQICDLHKCILNLTDQKLSASTFQCVKVISLVLPDAELTINRRSNSSERDVRVKLATIPPTRMTGLKFLSE